MKNTLSSVFASAVLVAGPVSATTLNYVAPLPGAASIASLSYSQVGDGDDWQFTLAATDLDAVFASTGAFIGSIAVEAPGAESVNFRGGLALSDVSGGVSAVVARNGGGPGGDFDFRIALGSGGDRLGGNESVAWTWNDSGFQSFSQLALHVQGLAGAEGSLWVLPSAVAEPGSLVLLLAGLGFLGKLGRRRLGAPAQ